ncbi:transposable element Tcb1 transposase [Trichonephila clavipes]|nr:transposable element Tcb1 transposase [Trichonephila clavipes]
MKHGGSSVMVWGVISYHGLGSLVVLRKMIKDDRYRSILANDLHFMLQTPFPGERPVFRDDNFPIHTSRCFQTWLCEHDDEVEYPTCCPESHLNITSLRRVGNLYTDNVKSAIFDVHFLKICFMEMLEIFHRIKVHLSHYIEMSF